MHVTLKFIGHVDDEQVDSIAVALAGVHSGAPVDMHFRGVGFFPTERRPRVFWCGIEASPNLAEIASSVEGALVPLKIPAESRKFVPHLTLARFDSPHGLSKLLEAAAELQSFDLGATRETEFHLFESILQKSGAEYAKLRSFAFVKGAA